MQNIDLVRGNHTWRVLEEVQESAGMDNHNDSSECVKSLLDPHLSVLEMLERKDNDTVMEASSRISRSWQNIESPADSKQLLSAKSSQVSNLVSILSSSSDTSDEEVDRINSLNSAGEGSSKNYNNPSPLQNPIYLPEFTDVTAGDNDDGIASTITKSLTSSSTISNSFVMPTLSLSSSQSQQRKFQILIFGRLGPSFYRTIPKQYQYLFHVPNQLNTLTRNEMDNFTAFLIIFEELKELVSLLNRISEELSFKKVPPPIIPICQPGQKIKVKSILKYFLKNNFVTLLSPIIIINDERALLKMFKTMQSISKTVISASSSTTSSDNEEEESSDPSMNDKVIDVKTIKESMMSSQKKKNKKKHHNNRRKEHVRSSSTSFFKNKWVVWSISLTVGAGMGYIISYCVFNSSKRLPLEKIAHQTRPGPLSSLIHLKSNKNLLYLERTTPNDYSWSYFQNTWEFCKETVNQLNSTFKKIIRKPFAMFENLITTTINSKDWKFDEQDRILALCYLLL
ncbi:hypothetical protein NCAS_0G00260 [Naumovozyma castellii]|uniref:Autophagy-related protein 32 n=1 Tax=Naumovozyma castellii TaxID=27288 RepID=G0VHM9_NAUCA|nr:hypothetical protein NCAS_0G00260 [Naumovozyma castellii CBS 4309]CCC70913.1 hypothetical protein NCAS_0G00260 [Naumovozyma castellii CBS 4309]